MARGAIAGSLIRLVQEKKWDELAEQVDGEPTSVGGTDAAARSLLHFVLWKRAPLSLLGAVLDADPSAAGQVDRDGRYPLHFAMCGHSAGAKYGSFVSKLIAAAPGAVEAPDKHGRVPLHYAHWREASDEVISALKTATPGVVGVCDKAGKKPVRALLHRHTYCSCRASTCEGSSTTMRGCLHSRSPDRLRGDCGRK